MTSSSNVYASSPREKYPYPTEFINVLDFVPKLTSNGNYENWKLLMEDFIDSLGLIGFIDGTIAADESNHDNYMAWKKSDNLVRRWMLATLDEEIRIQVLQFKTAKDLWKGFGEISDATRSLRQKKPAEKYPFPSEFNVDFVPKLSLGGNYQHWKFYMREFLRRRGLIGFIDGTAVAKKNDQDDYRAWKRSDGLVRRWILDTIDDEHARQQLLPLETAKDLWTELEELFDTIKSVWRLERYPFPSEFNVLDFVPKLSSEGNYKNWKLSMLKFIGRRGLIGFINGTTVAKKSDKDDYMAWERSDGLVRRWILETLDNARQRLLPLETAKELWTKLEQIFDLTKLWQLDEEREPRQGRYLELHKAAVSGDWEKAKGIIDHDPDAVRTPITFTPFSKSALHIAITSAGRNGFVKEILEKMGPEDVEQLVDSAGWTALHSAVYGGNVEGAKMLVNKNPNLPKVSDNSGRLPFHCAAQTRNTKMVHYLNAVTSHEDILLAKDDVVASLLYYLTWGEQYDIALTLLQQKPELALECFKVFNPIAALAGKHSSFPSGSSLNFWQSLIYLGVPMKSKGNNANLHMEEEGGGGGGGGGGGDIETPVVASCRFSGGGGGGGDIETPAVASCRISVRQRLHYMIWKIAERLVPSVKHIRETKERHHYALELVKFLCKEVAKSNLSTMKRIFKRVLCEAARSGIPEIIEEIVLSYPAALHFVDLDELNIITYAIMYRRERVFNIIYQLDVAWNYIARPSKFTNNNGLHVAAQLNREQNINLKSSVAGAVLQMQRELQWFKEVEKFTLPSDREARNGNGMTPVEVFSDTHESLVKEAEQWMKDTATSCTIVAALVATMVFAAAIAVPGGFGSDNGHPLFSKRRAFAIFGASDAVALFSSITSVLMFLLILTSRYGEEDFLYTLPKRLIYGLITLFISILSMMIAFSAALYLVFGDGKAWILIPIVTLASIPITLFGVWQLPLLVEMIKSTYGRGIFGKQSDRVLA